MREDHLLSVRQHGPKRWVAELLGTPLWNAGPTPEHAVGALVLTHGARLGWTAVSNEGPWVRALRMATRCAVPVDDEKNEDE